MLVSALGAGPVAVAARADLEAHGVTVVDAAGPEFPLAVSAVLVDDATGERSVVSPDGALAVAPAPSAEALRALPAPAVVLLDGHHPAIARAVLELTSSSWVPETPLITPDDRSPRDPQLILDAGRWRDLFAELMPRADVVAASADFRVPGHDDVVAGALAAGAGAVVVTHGAGPVTWATRGGEHGVIDVPPAEVRDTLGAGDAFHGALAAAIGAGEGREDAIRTAVRVAGTRVSQVGPRAWLSLVP